MATIECWNGNATEDNNVETEVKMKTAILILMLAGAAWAQVDTLDDRTAYALTTCIDSVYNWVCTKVITCPPEPLFINVTKAETTITVQKADTIWNFEQCHNAHDSLKTAIWKIRQLEKPKQQDPWGYLSPARY